MNKVTTCCKATYILKYKDDEGKNFFVCDRCKHYCTLEDAPAHTESMEDRFDILNDKEFLYLTKDKVKIIKAFIKSELERRDRELIEKIESKINTMNKSNPFFIAEENTARAIIDLIKNNK